MMALEALSSNSSWKIPLQTIFLNFLGMLLKLLRNCHSSTSNTENFNKLWDNFSSQVEGAEDSQAYFHLIFCRNTDTDTCLCKAIYLKQVRENSGICRKELTFLNDATRTNHRLFFLLCSIWPCLAVQPHLFCFLASCQRKGETCRRGMSCPSFPSQQGH